jgi:simple sugar transport system permease protein
MSAVLPAPAVAAPAGRGVFVHALVALALAFLVTAVLILMAGKNPLQAYASLLAGAFGSWDRIVVGLNKSAPYILAGVGIALCFRASVINIGAEGQIALGGLAASHVALASGGLPGGLGIAAALAAGAAAGAAWSALAAVIRLTRGVHEVLCTLMLNFVALLLVAQALHGALGEPGAGFPQSEMFQPALWLPKLGDLHIGIALALAAAGAAHLVLWHTPVGMRWRLIGASRAAAQYAGVSFARAFLGVMAAAGALAGVAGAVECLGVHYRLIEGFSAGFGFNAVAIALMAARNPLAVVPAALFFGFLETGALSMQRQIGVPSSLVLVIQGVTIIIVLCVLGRGGERARPG